MPVGDADRLVGVVTDRDIVVRALAGGLRPGAPVAGVMSAPVRCCLEDDSLEAAASCMARHQLRRLPVLNIDRRLVGVLSLGDLARAGTEAACAARCALVGASRAACAR
ncbi:CBS domain-containing protein [Caulobacter segnis]|uniref:CBS domain-containing protein n=1 Tax=Caulobacter segnis TaxID=88688 RepID=UPI00240FD588|nr:CBS domain-containing protein [Caulobacter segnis]MDG2520355.1 CBS domain-containing protein [Caulobacter segnis]